MTQGDARRSQSAISFSFAKKQGETSNERAKKRARHEETEDSNPTVIVSQPSTATITEESVN